MINCSSNTLIICKFLETAEGIVKPNNGDEFHIVVESCSMKRYYSLNSSNCFCVQLEHLSNESYCVYEESKEYDVTYELDGCEVSDPYFDFNDQDYHHVRIINHQSSDKGALHIQKRVFDACGKEIISDDSFNVRIRGLNYDTKRVLNSDNNYHTVLENLDYGCYEVSESNNEDYTTSYYVNGTIKERGMISVDSDDNSIEIWNRLNNGTHILQVSKWVRKDGHLVKPSYDQSFDFILKDQYACKEYTLNCNNHFCTTIEGNKDDTFVLEELEAADVIYEVDGEEVEVVEVVMNEDHDVRIINLNDVEPDPKPTPDPDPEPCPQTVLKIQKWMEEDGRLYRPNVDDVFSFRIQGYDNVSYDLTSANDFTMEINDITPGYYCIYEEYASNYNVVYDVNGVIQEDGYVFIDYGVSEVSIINQNICDLPEPEENIIHLVKRVNVCNNANEVAMPESGSFEIYVSGPNGVEYYTLSPENNYETFLSAVNGQYTIYEVNPVNAVTYRLDGVDYIDEVTFNLQDKSHEVMIINYVNRINYII